ncbi:hypothetical protein [Pseudochryseolinea flava]|uniref:Uncharacterized protein n=1 Tax=Pseudochryseolinea flava TaxID=2059302 RepID=A0A364XZL1_9BACT|nr:hypothetical protein [Pseudochryseolinea flava]RAV99062.1 hypothetical protein DQQ10_20930 [Pseudochryseolinea flava]
MKMGMVNIKPWVGLCCEALMLVFIFLCAHTEGSFDSRAETDSSPKASACMQQMTFRVTIGTESIYQALPRIPLTTIIKSFAPVDIAGLKVTLSEALAIGHAERNYFYNQLTDNAP